MPICPLCRLHCDGELKALHPEAQKLLEIEACCSSCGKKLATSIADAMLKTAAQIKGE